MKDTLEPIGNIISDIVSRYTKREIDHDGKELQSDFLDLMIELTNLKDFIDRYHTELAVSRTAAIDQFYDMAKHISSRNITEADLGLKHW